MDQDRFFEMPTPLVIVIGITLGVPLVLLLAIVALTPGISSSLLTAVLSLAVFSIFGTLMIYEIKRLAEQQPPNEKQE